MKIRFQAVYDFDNDIIRALRRLPPAIDFQTGHEAGLKGLNDQEVLAIATREGRMLVTHDRHTMPWEFAQFLSIQTSPGVVLISQDLPLSIAVEELLLIWEASEAEEWNNSIFSVPL